MENTKTSKNIKILVLTCPEYEHLIPEFTERFDKYYSPREFSIWCGDHEWSTDLITALYTVTDEYLIILHEDFFFTEKVDLDALDKIIEYMHKHKKVGRIGLVGAHTRERVFHHEDIYWKHKDDAEYLCSFEASIWRKSFLTKYLRRGEDPWVGEVQTSRRAKGKGETVLWAEKPILIYKDAMRRGVKQKI